VAESVFALACARAPEGHGDQLRWPPQQTRGASRCGRTRATMSIRRAERRRRTAWCGACARRDSNAGDAVALVCGNRTEFAVVRFATHRAGLRLTPVNWHLDAGGHPLHRGELPRRRRCSSTPAWPPSAAGLRADPGAWRLRVSHRRRAAGLHGAGTDALGRHGRHATSPTRRSAPPCCTPRAPRGAPRGCTVRRWTRCTTRGASAADC
jgi:hypothetical protein